MAKRQVNVAIQFTVRTGGFGLLSWTFESNVLTWNFEDSKVGTPQLRLSRTPKLEVLTERHMSGQTELVSTLCLSRFGSLWLLLESFLFENFYFKVSIRKFPLESSIEKCR